VCNAQQPLSTKKQLTPIGFLNVSCCIAKGTPSDVQPRFSGYRVSEKYAPIPLPFGSPNYKEDHVQNPFKHPVWQRVIYHAKRIYFVLRHAATVISIAFASFKVWQFVSWWLSQSA
jgi:hypothetical protein